jgi:hypothetical protein
MRKVLLSFLFIWGVIANAQVAQNPELICTGTWGARAALNQGQSSFTLREPGKKPVSYKIVNISEENLGTMYLSENVLLMVATEHQSSYFFANGKIWRLNFGCKISPQQNVK